jgi:hypothetical protein
MNFPFYKNSSFKFAQNLSGLDVSLRSSQTKLLPEDKVSGHLSKVLVHLAWPKDHARGFCEADEVAFYLICGKWGKPTKISQKTNWKGEAVSSAIGLQAELFPSDTLYNFLDSFSVLF